MDQSPWDNYRRVLSDSVEYRDLLGLENSRLPLLNTKIRILRSCYMLRIFDELFMNNYFYCCHYGLP